MKWFRILTLNFEHVSEYKLRTLLYLFLPIVNNLVIILFWNGAHTTGGSTTASAIPTYYVLVTICSLFLTSHTEYDVGELHIKQGGLINYLLKPVPYYWMVLLSELPYRVMQSVYALFFVGLIVYGAHIPLNIHLSVTQTPFILVIFIFGYLISYTYKIDIAFLSFWMKDIGAVLELAVIVHILLSGSIVPVHLYPVFLQKITLALPFVYSVYYPVMSIQGSYTEVQLIQIIGMQLVWFAALKTLNHYMWKKGLQQFTAVGQ